MNKLKEITLEKINKFQLIDLIILVLSVTLIFAVELLRISFTGYVIKTIEFILFASLTISAVTFLILSILRIIKSSKIKRIILIVAPIIIYLIVRMNSNEFGESIILVSIICDILSANYLYANSKKTPTFTLSVFILSIVYKYIGGREQPYVLGVIYTLSGFLIMALMENEINEFILKRKAKLQAVQSNEIKV